MLGKITLKIDPVADDELLGTALAHCQTRRERRLVELRGMHLIQRIIASRVERSVGWTCETLAEIRRRCSWENATRRKMKPRKVRRARISQPRREPRSEVAWDR
jgi:hypothetical protein